MKRLLAIALFAAIAVSSCGASLRMSATAPSQLNDGTCSVPALLSATPGSSCYVHFRYEGPTTGEDSVLTTVGTLVSVSRTVTPGSYRVIGWASNAGGQGCRDTIQSTVTAAPWRVTFQ